MKRDLCGFVLWWLEPDDKRDHAGCVEHNNPKVIMLFCCAALVGAEGRYVREIDRARLTDGFLELLLRLYSAAVVIWCASYRWLRPARGGMLNVK